MSENHRDLTIVIPVYNEPESLEEVVRGLQNGLEGRGLAFEIICVDDGSDEPTRAILARLDGITVVTHDRNRGYGAALKTGFSHAKGELVTFIDADCSYPVAEIHDLVNAFTSKNGSHMCIGSRLMKKGNSMEALRVIGNWLYASTVSLCFPIRIRDACSGMRVFRREILPRLELSTLSDDLDFSPQLTSRCCRRGLTVTEHPISYYQRKGYSKLKILRHGFSFLFRILEERFSR